MPDIPRDAVEKLKTAYNQTATALPIDVREQFPDIAHGITSAMEWLEYVKVLVVAENHAAAERLRDATL